MDTIFALATARGKSGVAVIRVSGPAAFSAARALAGVCPEPRKSSLRRLHSADGTMLDEALVLAFEAGHSFTGEDVVEFQVHGSGAIISAVLSELAEMPDLRMAEAGEFTRRALENERLDLAQVEGLGDLIEAETEAQRRQALQVLTGSLGRSVEAWRRDLLRAAALIEATIDFADEEVPVDVSPEVADLLERSCEALRREAEGSQIAERIREGFEVALVGPPNAGKSTLLNALAGREAAITSSVAGTTRDVIEVRMDLRGLPVTILDMAGVRETEDEVESIGVGLARRRATEADLRVILLEAPGTEPVLPPQPDDPVLLGKVDLHPGQEGISGATGEGLDQLTSRIGAVLEQRASNAGTATRARHREAILRSLGHLDAARDKLAAGIDGELIAEDLRLALRALDALVGRVDVEHILGEIFASFCIGK